MAAVIFYFITSCVIEGTPFSWTTAIGNLLNLQGICCKSLVSPFWSLSYEVWFYVVLGTLAVLLMTKSNRVKLIGFILFIASVSVFVLGLKMHYLLIWLMGAIAYISRPTKKNKILLAVSIIGFLTSVVYWQFSKETRSLEMAVEGTNKEFLEVTMSLMACLFIQQVILFEPKSRMSRFVERQLGKMAMFSYTLYLSHRIVFLWIIAYIWPKACCDFSLYGISIFVAIVLMTLSSCWMLYLMSEKHSPQIKKVIKSHFYL